MREEQTNSRINEKKLGVVRVIMSDGSSLHVVQQPPGNHGYVSSRSETLTQFNDAECYDTIGFLAHNDLAGQHILDLEINKNLQVTFDDGSIRLFRVTNIQAYQALSPSSPHSNFVNLDDIETTLSSSELFRKIYTAKGRLIFQTCIASEGLMNWGRIFVTARPLVVPQHWHGPTMFASHMSKYGNFASSLSSDGRASTP